MRNKITVNGQSASSKPGFASRINKYKAASTINILLCRIVFFELRSMIVGLGWNFKY